jgi:type I restriction enzyme S subunit
MNSSNAMNRNAVLTHSWKKVKLGELCVIEKGTTGIQKAIPGEYPLVVTGEERKSHNEFQFDNEAVLIPLVSSTGHGHKSLKRIHYQSGKFALGSILCAVIPKDKKILNAEYLYRYLDLNKEEELVGRMKGMANVSLPVNEIAQIEIPLPSLNEQKLFVEEYKLLETQSGTLNTELTHQLDTVKQLRQAFLREAMQGKLVEQNPNDEPASELLQTIKAEKERLLNSSASLGRRSLEGGSQKLKPPTLKGRAIHPIKPEEIPFEIPANWVWCRLGEIVENYQNGISTRGTNDSTSAIVLRLADIKNCLVDISDTRKINLPSNIINKHKLNESDILITRVNGSVELVGNFNYVGKHDLDITACDHFIRLKLAPSINSDYIYLLGKLKHIRKTIESNFKTTSGQKTINQGHVDNLLIPLPPLEEQQRIVNKLEQLMVFCDELEKSIKQSKEQNEKLLQQVLREALSGSSNEVSAEDLACVLA